MASAIVASMSSTTPYYYLGCYRDKQRDRVLSGPSKESRSMTLKVCAEYCDKDGYKYFGLEFGKECYCGKDRDDPDKYGHGHCDYKCSGNRHETCGGDDAISVYKYDYYHSSSSSSDDSSSSRSDDSSDSYDDYKYLGCYKDDKRNRIMDRKKEDRHMTTKMCKKLCDGKDYFGTQYGKECWCGDKRTDYDKYGSSSKCTHKCGGDDHERCGGRDAMMVYEYKDKKDDKPKKPSYVGCYKDRKHDRIMRYKDSSSRMTNKKCEELCKGYKYFGTQHGDECWCSDKSNYDKHGRSDRCDKDCKGDRHEKCGGYDAMSVYKY